MNRNKCRLILFLIFSLLFLISFSTVAVEADDFNAKDLNTDLWTFKDPIGNSKVELNGKQASISVPSGTAHDAWGSENFAARLMQSVADEDFEVEVKIDYFSNTASANKKQQ
jgi:hypothetical protein